MFRKYIFYNSSLAEFDSLDSSLTSERSLILVACDTKKLTFMWPRFFRLLFSIVFIIFFFRRRSRRRSWFWNKSTCFNSIFRGSQFVSCCAFIVHTIRGRWSRTFTLANNSTFSSINLRDIYLTSFVAFDTIEFRRIFFWEFLEMFCLTVDAIRSSFSKTSIL